jgi:hypothetical protein
MDPRDRAYKPEELPTIRPWVKETWPYRLGAAAIHTPIDLANAADSAVRTAIDQGGAFLPSDVPEAADSLVKDTTNFTGTAARQGITKSLVESFLHPSTDVTLGIFAGPRAKNAPIDALYDAFRMKTDKAPVGDIWRDTGWAELPDKKWMYEISDDLYRLHPNPENADKFVGPHHNEKFGWDVGGATSHGPLFEAYPDIAKVFLKRDAKPRSGYSEAPYTALGRKSEGTIGIAPEVAEARPSWTSVGAGTDTNSPESVLLHELQHQVQAREGWVPGSSPMITQSRMRDALNAEIAAGRGVQVQPLMAGMSDPLVIHRLYERDLGEMMSRATQYRQDLSPLERRQRHPFLDFDRGIENAIVPR